MSIVHVVHRDKFTSGYINFMKTEMGSENIFITLKDGFELSLVDEENIYYIENYPDCRRNSQILRILEESNLIIFTGIFDSLGLLRFLPRHILKKTYLQFWGGDFYYFAERRPLTDVSWNYWKHERVKCFKKCAGFIFLIEGEYEKFQESFKIRKPYFVAPMPADSRIHFRIKELRGKRRGSCTKVLIGNSATSTNHHMGVIDWIARYRDEDMEVYIPLSYGGDNEYCEKIMAYAADKLGDKFYPVLNYMDLNSYIEFVADMDIGIFNNNRQQAMGNILMCLGLGKKVYLREDTSMWARYVEDGYQVFPIKKTECMTYEGFIDFDEAAGVKNQMLYDEKETEDKAIRLWEKVIKPFWGGVVRYAIYEEKSDCCDTLYGICERTMASRRPA